MTVSETSEDQLISSCTVITWSGFLLVTGPLGCSQHCNEEHLSLLPPCGHFDSICWLLLPPNPHPHFHTTPHTPLPPRPKVPGTQQLNKITQISHVDHSKHFQLCSPGQLQLAKVTCMILGLHSKAHLMSHVPLRRQLQQLCRFTYMQHIRRLWWMSKTLGQECNYSKTVKSHSCILGGSRNKQWTQHWHIISL